MTQIYDSTTSKWSLSAPLAPITAYGAAASAATIAVVGVGLPIYFRKRNR